jgi:hypothetical protein
MECWMKAEKWTLVGKAFNDCLGVFWIPYTRYLDPPDGIGYMFPDIDEPKPWTTTFESLSCTVLVQAEGQRCIDPLYNDLVGVQKEPHESG